MRTRRDATPGTRSDSSPPSKLRYRLCRPVVALDLHYVPGARERDEVRTASNYLARPDDDSLPQPSRQVWLRERHEEGGNHERQEEQSG